MDNASDRQDSKNPPGAVPKSDREDSAERDDVEAVLKQMVESAEATGVAATKPTVAKGCAEAEDLSMERALEQMRSAVISGDPVHAAPFFPTTSHETVQTEDFIDAFSEPIRQSETEISRERALELAQGLGLSEIETDAEFDEEPESEEIKKVESTSSQELLERLHANKSRLLELLQTKSREIGPDVELERAGSVPPEQSTVPLAATSATESVPTSAALAETSTEEAAIAAQPTVDAAAESSLEVVPSSAASESLAQAPVAASRHEVAVPELSEEVQPTPFELPPEHPIEAAPVQATIPEIEGTAQASPIDQIELQPALSSISQAEGLAAEIESQAAAPAANLDQIEFEPAPPVIPFETPAVGIEAVASAADQSISAISSAIQASLAEEPAVLPKEQDRAPVSDPTPPAKAAEPAVRKPEKRAGQPGRWYPGKSGILGLSRAYEATGGDQVRVAEEDPQIKQLLAYVRSERERIRAALEKPLEQVAAEAPVAATGAPTGAADQLAPQPVTPEEPKPRARGVAPAGRAVVASAVRWLRSPAVVLSTAILTAFVLLYMGLSKRHVSLAQVSAETVARLRSLNDSTQAHLRALVAGFGRGSEARLRKLELSHENAELESEKMRGDIAALRETYAKQIDELRQKLDKNDLDYRQRLRRAQDDLAVLRQQVNQLQALLRQHIAETHSQPQTLLESPGPTRKRQASLKLSHGTDTQLLPGVSLEVTKANAKHQMVEGALKLAQPGRRSM